MLGAHTFPVLELTIPGMQTPILMIVIFFFLAVINKVSNMVVIKIPTSLPSRLLSNLFLKEVISPFAEKIAAETFVAPTSIAITDIFLNISYTNLSNQIDTTQLQQSYIF